MRECFRAPLPLSKFPSIDSFLLQLLRITHQTFSSAFVFSPARSVAGGTIIDSASKTEVRVLRDAVLGVASSGKICFVEDSHAEPLASDGELILRNGPAVSLTGIEIVQLPPRAFLCPGFVDTHTHAPQFAFAGLGYDLQLLEWLET